MEEDVFSGLILLQLVIVFCFRNGSGTKYRSLCGVCESIFAFAYVGARLLDSMDDNWVNLQTPPELGFPDTELAQESFPET